VVATRVVVAENQGHFGGGIGIDDASLVSIENALLVGNTSREGGGSGYGGGIYVGTTGTVQLSQLTVVGNENGEGGGIDFRYQTGTFEIANSIVAYNTCDSSSMGCGMYAKSNTTIGYVDVFGNEDQYGTSSGVNGGADYSAGTSGNLEEDPLFVSWKSGADWASQDLRLQSVAEGFPADSPCIDAGHPKTRDVDGTTADMGYYGGEEAP